MRISFCFQGWVSGAYIEEVMDVRSGNMIKVQLENEQTIIDGLNEGRYAVSLEDSISNCKNSECEIFDYDDYGA